jgi:MraZ protein
MIFSGRSEHTLDPNGRVIIPRRMRYSLGETFAITRGYEKCLRVFTKERVELIKAEADKLASPLSVLFDPNALRKIRQIFSEMADAGTDGQGRVLIPQELREYAEIGNAVVIVGVGDWIEIWNPENWKAYAEQELIEEKLTCEGGATLAVESADDSGDVDDEVS